MIKVEGLSRRYGNNNAVENVSFDIELMDVVGLLGHNGAGKTTIMKMLTGCLEPSGGSIQIDGKALADNRLIAQANIGYLPENTPLYPDMNVLDYLEFAAALKGVAVDKRRERIIYAIEKTRITDVAEKKISNLSRGYRQRLGVAQAIIGNPGILILDEPTNGLDPSQILEMRSLIRELAQSSTVIISTHVLQEVEAMCNRVLIINKGRLALDSSLAELKCSNRLALKVGCRLDTLSDVLDIAGGLKILDCKEDQGQYAYTLEAVSGRLDELIPSLVRELSLRECRIFSVYPVQRDLESVFRDISTGISFLPETTGSVSGAIGNADSSGAGLAGEAKSA